MSRAGRGGKDVESGRARARERVCVREREGRGNIGPDAERQREITSDGEVRAMPYALGEVRAMP